MKIMKREKLEKIVALSKALDQIEEIQNFMNSAGKKDDWEIKFNPWYSSYIPDTLKAPFKRLVDTEVERLEKEIEEL